MDCHQLNNNYFYSAENMRQEYLAEPITLKINFMRIKKSCWSYLAGILLMGCHNATPQSTVGWNHLPEILKNIVPPTFPDKDFSILDYGAKADSTTDCLPAITKAIDACHTAGGGHVIIPPGTYFVKGPVHLKSNVDFHLDSGAVLKFSTDPNDYLPLVLTRYEGIELMNYSPLIYAYGQQNIAVTGEGILDGQADNDHWWNWTGAKRFGWKEGMPSMRDSANRPALAGMAAEGVPVKERIFGKGHYLRPSFLEVYRCKNVLVKGVTIKNTPFWILHPTLSQNVTIDSVTTISLGPNNDGCDPESCTDVLIENCFFSNGDDCIAIKSGRDQDGRRINIPSKNIIIQNCQMEDGHCGVGIGSETSGGVENVYAQHCKMSSPDLDRAIRIKSNNCRGGVMKNFYFRDIQVGQVKEAVVRVNMFYGNEKGPDCHYPPSLSNVHITNVQSNQSEYAINIQGLKDKPVTGIDIDSCSFDHVEKENVIEQVKDIKITHTTINGKIVNIQ